MGDTNSRLLQTMLERLLASLAGGPGLNCRPHASRQRIDLWAMDRLGDGPAAEALRRLLGPDQRAKLVARVPPPREADLPDSPARRAFADQQALLTKLRIIADDAATYEQDTGVHVLHIGYPLLSLPPGTFGIQAAAGTRRIIAPVAFVPATLTIKAAATPAVELSCREEDIDRVIPNAALLAWLEAQAELSDTHVFEDEEGRQPWREICALVRIVCDAVSIATPGEFELPQPPDAGDPLPQAVPLVAAPRVEELHEKPSIVPAAVLGLFPAANQGLLRDMQAMVRGEGLGGTVPGFIRAGIDLDAPPAEPAAPATAVQRRTRAFGEERMVAAADPCQSRAVKLARSSRGLVIHGPPGTGKSQTITNIIADYLSRGQRVLMVCDKRTALDVVYNRLEHLGLAELCALIHDPQRDQRELYLSIRQQLDNLPQRTTDARAEGRLALIDAELQQIHDELTRLWRGLMSRPQDGGQSFHEMVGAWLAIGFDEPLLKGVDLSAVTPAQLELYQRPIDEVLQRAARVRLWENPWRQAAGIALEQFLAAPMQQFRDGMAAALEAARAADATLHPSIAAFGDADLAQQAAARTELARRVRAVLTGVSPQVRGRWAEADVGTIWRLRQQLRDVHALIAEVQAEPLDAELSAGRRAAAPPMAQLNEQSAALDGYRRAAGRWYGFACVGRRRAAAAVLRQYGLQLGPDAAARAARFLAGLRARMVLGELERQLSAERRADALLDDEALLRSLGQHAQVMDLLLGAQDDPALHGLGPAVTRSLVDDTAARSLLDGLDRSPARAQALLRLEAAMRQTLLFGPWLAGFLAQLRGGREAAGAVAALLERLETLEDVLRVPMELGELPTALRDAVAKLLSRPVDAQRDAAAIRRAVLAAAIAQRLRQDPALQPLDAQRIANNFSRHGALEEKKRTLVKQTVLHRWVSRQKQRLLAGTGTRLNGLGADLKRRLLTRGPRSMRLRQVVAVGSSAEGGDPLFDLRPLWMASPETVAQVFPLRQVFDVVIFDEASQCRLEEALPVLARAGRLVIAGDPQQLPPTRFFESAVTSSDDNDDIQTDQDLFEVQQGQVEDLLTAALNLQIEQSYLDVHYRSKSAELIEFSNRHFYRCRLQPVPTHPSRRPAEPPIVLHRVEGLYERRMNEPEAKRVVEIVRGLLDQPKPPSIGIACFNLAQRDLIAEKLDEAAEADEKFAAQLAEARARRGAGSFEGLFVKNLENVQGDERDHMIISTTYGPDASGRFYRRFGPLGQAGGGRRLNVLITRARQQTHLVTSIPRQAYLSLPEIPAGQTPGGGWLLLAYLAYAEQLQQTRAGGEVRAGVRPAGPQVGATRCPSAFVEALAGELAAKHGTPSQVYWGNDGLGIDLAMARGQGPERVGVLVDGCRFPQAEDPVQWDIFRTAMHESQGWRLHRLWTPQFFRDPQGCIREMLGREGDGS